MSKYSSFVSVWAPNPSWLWIWERFWFWLKWQLHILHQMCRISFVFQKVIWNDFERSNDTVFHKSDQKSLSCDVLEGNRKQRTVISVKVLVIYMGFYSVQELKKLYLPRHMWNSVHVPPVQIRVRCRNTVSRFRRSLTWSVFAYITYFVV